MEGRALGSAPGPLDRDSIYLELPDLGVQATEGIVRVAHPESVDRVLVHIPRSRILKVFSRVNTVGSGIVQTLRSREGEIVCELDLARYARRYAFAAGANTLEVKIVPEAGSEPVYVSWVVVPPDDPYAWESGQQIAGPVAGPETPEPPQDPGFLGLTVLEQLPDRSERELTRGYTLAERVVMRARFSRPNEKSFVEIRGTGPDGDAMQTTRRRVGESPETEALLSPGLNLLSVAVWSNEELIEERSYRLERRNPSRPEGFTGRKWAVLVGISDYKNNEESLPDLQFAGRDATAFRDFLQSPRGGSFRPENTLLITDAQATYREIRTALFNFLADAQPDDFVFVFLAGHGMPDSKNPFNFFFLAHDSEVENLGGTALPMLDLNTSLNFTIRARRVVVLADACHSGAAVAIPGARGARPFNLVNHYLQALGQEEGRLILTASRPHEYSFEDAAWGGGHGVFTYFVLEGLRGAADVDEDKIVTAGELLDYVRYIVPRETKGKQNPSFEKSGFNPDFPLASTG